MSETTTILTDPRTIKEVYFSGPAGPGPFITAGECGVVEIVAYGEPGPYCPQPWILVRREDGSDSRFNAATIEGIRYAPAAGFAQR